MIRQFGAGSSHERLIDHWITSGLELGYSLAGWCPLMGTDSICSELVSNGQSANGSHLQALCTYRYLLAVLLSFIGWNQFESGLFSNHSASETAFCGLFAQLRGNGPLTNCHFYACSQGPILSSENWMQIYLRLTNSEFQIVARLHGTD